MFGIYFSSSPFLRSKCLVFFFLVPSDSHLAAVGIFCCTKLFISCVSLFNWCIFLWLRSFFPSLSCTRSFAEPEFVRDVDLKLKHEWWMNEFFPSFFFCMCFYVVFLFCSVRCSLFFKMSIFLFLLIFIKKMTALARRDVRWSFIGYVHYHYDLKQRLWHSLFFFVCSGLKQRK